MDVISTHSAREDGDALDRLIKLLLSYFNPLRPRGRRPSRGGRRVMPRVISTHSAREDGDITACRTWPSSRGISTHSAREDGD